MKNLNIYVVNLSDSEYVTAQQMIIEFNDESNTYTYPEEDFCNFVHFPHENRVFPLINTKQDLSCTCTLLWLIQRHNESEKVLETRAIQNCWRSGDLRQRIMKCNFDQKVSECLRKSQRRYYSSSGNNSNSLGFLNLSIAHFLGVCFLSVLIL